MSLQEYTKELTKLNDLGYNFYKKLNIKHNDYRTI
jgi:hypothetical protein